MDDAEFVRRIQMRIQESTGHALELELGEEGEFTVDMDRPVPRVTMGREVLQYAGRARMLTQYAILCLRERRKVSEQEFLLFLRRN